MCVFSQIYASNTLCLICFAQYGLTNIDLMHYAELVRVRGLIFAKEGLASKAHPEYSQLLAGLVRDNADNDLIKRVNAEWMHLLAKGKLQNYFLFTVQSWDD